MVVLDSGGAEVADVGLFPDAFGDPHASDGASDSIFEPAGVVADLADSVAGGNHGQDWFEEGAADDLDAATLDQCCQAIDILGMASVEPFHEGATGVQADAEGFVGLKDVEKGEVAVLVGFFKDVVEVADRLVIV